MKLLEDVTLKIGCHCQILRIDIPERIGFIPAVLAKDSISLPRTSRDPPVASSMASGVPTLSQKRPGISRVFGKLECPELFWRYLLANQDIRLVRQLG